jgi:hypothetical protein
MRPATCTLLLVVVAGCTPVNQNTPPAGARARVGNDGAEIDMTADGIRAYVARGDYQQWLAESAVRDSLFNSPHGKVRVFFNQTAAAALKADQLPLPVGAMVVKELYRSDGTTLAGYAAMVKYTAGSSWTWWEAFTPDLTNTAAFGNDHSTCRGCHAAGKDSVRTPVP